ncbi:DoxX family protein [Mesorhizobium sp. CGMCC 1.15528]|uniref:DoxX family protein n=1 Tax=Mesorhizobium zhangyense TaxID=1776730 RepID=A0A7C9R9A3_9HYPH|nr:DoxX family protein [Mesorhizobium zhangyense]NGN43334.1 DoxX family protein [Mesorhizobium zhangyense]
MSTNSSAADSGIAANASAAILVGRVLISILFILAGFGKLTAIAGTAGFFESLGLPAPTVTAVVVGLVEFFGGLAVLVGFKTRIAAILLAVFTMGATAVAHLDFSQAGNALMLQKNLGLVAGFIFLAVIGAGAYSIDGRGR